MDSSDMTDKERRRSEKRERERQNSISTSNNLPRSKSAGYLTAAASSPDDSDLEGGLIEGSILNDRWIAGCKIGEGTFSRIYAAQPVASSSTLPACGEVVLKVNKRGPKGGGTTATAATASSDSTT